MDLHTMIDINGEEKKKKKRNEKEDEVTRMSDLKGQLGKTEKEKKRNLA